MLFLHATQQETHNRTTSGRSSLLHLHQNKPAPRTSAIFRLLDRNTRDRRLLSIRFPSLLILHAGSQGCQIESQLSRHEDEVAAPSTTHLFIAGPHEETDNRCTHTW